MIDLEDLGGPCDPDDEDFRERVEAMAHKAFMLFEEGVEYDEETGKVSIDPKVQADIVLGVLNLRKDMGLVVNALGALKYILKKEIKPPYPPRLAMALVLADNLIEDPEDVEIFTMPVEDPDEVMN
jgi:hypothetical protein